MTPMLNPIVKLQTLSSRKFAEFGFTAMAYVKPVSVEGRVVYAVHAANGAYLWHYDDRETAFTAIGQLEVEPLSVH